MAAEMNGSFEATPSGGGGDLVPVAPVSTRPARPLAPAAPQFKPLSPIPDAMELLRGLQRRWLLALTLAVILGGVSGTVAWFSLPPGKPTVEARLRMLSAPPHVVFATENNDFETFKATQVAMIRGRMVLNAALRNPKAANLSVVQAQPDALEWLEKQVHIGFTGSPEIMQVSMVGEQSDELVSLINAIVDAYLTEVVNKDRIKKEESHRKLKDISRRYEDKLSALRANMRKLQEDVGPGDKAIVALKQQTVQLELDQAKTDLVRLRHDLKVLRVRYDAMKAGEKVDPVVFPADVNKVIGKDPFVQSYEAGVRAFEMQMQETEKRAVLGKKDPTYLNLQKKMLAVKDLIAARKKSLRPGIVEKMREEAKVAGNSDLLSLEQQVARMTTLEAVMSKDTQELAAEAKKMVGKTLDLIEFQREMEEKEEMVKEMRLRANKLEVEMEAEGRVSVIQDPVVRKPDEVARKAKMAGGVGFAFFALGVFAVCFLESRTRRMDTPSDVSLSTGLNIVGTLPVYRASRGPFRRSRGISERRIVESVDMTRTMLLHASHTSDLQVVAIVSAVAGEGKTSLAAHLSTSLARSGKRTLLIDGDLRKPDIHEVFHRPLVPGVCEVFRAEASLEQALVETGLDNLWLMPAGAWDDKALRSLDSGAGLTLLDSLRPKFDFIIVDTSPLLALRDALIFSQNADGVLFSLMAHVSQVHRIRAAYEKLHSVRANVLGAVLNATSDDATGYGYNGYSGAYYGSPSSANGQASSGASVAGSVSVKG